MLESDDNYKVHVQQWSGSSVGMYTSVPLVNGVVSLFHSSQYSMPTQDPPHEHTQHEKQ